MKTYQSKWSLEHETLVLILPHEPEMEDVIEIPIYGKGVVCGLNDNYMDTGQTWLMIKWQDSKTDQFQFIIVEV